MPPPQAGPEREQPEVAPPGPPQRSGSHSVPGQGLAHRVFNIVFLEEKMWCLMQVTAASSLHT